MTRSAKRCPTPARWSRHTDAVLDPAELRELIKVDAIDPAKWHGLNTELVFAEDCAWYADLRDDGLTLALADQPGIEELDHIEREVVFVRTSLSLPDAHAAAIRALLEINRRPRPMPQRGLSMETLSGLATAAGPSLAEHGFTGRLRLVLEDGEPSGVHGYYRTCEDRLLQVVRIWNGIGGMPDGTLLEGTVSVKLELFDVPTLDPAESIILVRGSDFPQGVTVADDCAAGPSTCCRPVSPSRGAVPSGCRSAGRRHQHRGGSSTVASDVVDGIPDHIVMADPEGNEFCVV